MELRAADYADSYAVDLPESMDAARFAQRVLETAPTWLERLLTLRDALVGRFGFKAQQRNYGTPVEIVAGRRYGPLCIQEVSSRRVICGDDDDHLTFTATFSVDDEQSIGSFTTEVYLHDAVGRLYFAVVKPFHRLIIPALIAAPFPGRARSQPAGPSGA